jgi:hypothetical protein
MEPKHSPLLHRSVSSNVICIQPNLVHSEIRLQHHPSVFAPVEWLVLFNYFTKTSAFISHSSTPVTQSINILHFLL